MKLININCKKYLNNSISGKNLNINYNKFIKFDFKLLQKVIFPHI